MHIIILKIPKINGFVAGSDFFLESLRDHVCPTIFKSFW